MHTRNGRRWGLLFAAVAVAACNGPAGTAPSSAGSPPPPPPPVAPTPRIVFDLDVDADTGRRDLYTIAIDGTGLSRLTEDSADHHSPTANTSAVFFGSVRVAGSIVAHVPLAGSSLPTPDSAFGIADDPAFAPDGQTLAYLSMASGLPRVWVAHLDGTNAHRLAAADGGWDGAVEGHPEWSPTGGRIAYASSRSGSSTIWIANVNGASGSAALLTGSPTGASVEPAWSPDGSQIVFTSTRDGPTDLYTVTIATGTVTRLTARGNVGQPVWLADGRIVFTQWTAGVAGLAWLDPRTTAVVHPITTGGSAEHAASLP